MTDSNPDKQSSQKDINNELEAHFRIIQSCSVKTDDGKRILLAARPVSRYPYFYPRDAACASALLAYLSTSGLPIADDAYGLLETIAGFVLEVVRDDGYLGQRYALSGEEKSIYKQEDNIAHGLIILSNYLLTAEKRKENIQDLNKLLFSIKNASQFAIKNYYRPEINLFHSTTSIHESALEEGFSCWTNFAYLRAFTLVSKVNDDFDAPDIIPDKILTFKSAFKHNLFSIMVANKCMIPDVTMEEGGYIMFVTPLMWSHVEYMKALLYKHGLYSNDNL